jgi:methionyl-tRNA synthetase
MTQNPKDIRLQRHYLIRMAPSHWPFGRFTYLLIFIPRYLRLKGRDGLCAATWNMLLFRWKKKGITPQEVIDKYDGIIRKSFIDFDISFDNYSRTSAKIHDSFRVLPLYMKRWFYRTSNGAIVWCESRSVLSRPFCNRDLPKMWQWRSLWRPMWKCGSTLNATDLINPKSTITGDTPVNEIDETLVLPLNRYEDFLKKDSRRT